MNTRKESPRETRIAGAALAVVWLSIGAVSICLAARASSLLLGVFGVAALGYGLVWLRVMHLSRRLASWREAFPFRRKDNHK